MEEKTKIEIGIVEAELEKRDMDMYAMLSLYNGLQKMYLDKCVEVLVLEKKLRETEKAMRNERND